MVVKECVCVGWELCRVREARQLVREVVGVVEIWEGPLWEKVGRRTRLRNVSGIVVVVCDG